MELQVTPFTVQVCKDGSSTIFSEHYQQCFHNPNGALTESLYVFFESGNVLDKLKFTGHISILEVGFGTGLNAWILGDWLVSKVPDGNAQFYSVEKNPIPIETALACGYSKILRLPNLPAITRNTFEQLQTPGLHSFEISTRYQLQVFSGDYFDMPKPDFTPDLVFYDAFSPEKNPELWTTEAFLKIKEFSGLQTLLLTYCASSAARASMAEAGWYLAKAPGVLGKREITIATLNPDLLESYKKINHEKLIERRKAGEI